MGRLGRRPRGETGTGPGALPKAIAALSRALPGGPSPETFRRAKFDLPEAVAELWSLLFSLLWLIHQEDKVSPRDLPDALEGQIRFVKWVLRCHGYGRQHFYQLPEVGSHGSCELLLAFSWLLAYLSLPEQFLFLRCVHQGDGVWISSIHLYTRGCHPDQSIGHLSVPETEILRFPESSKQLLQELESENSCLEAFLEWKHMELVYWQWMDTVLDTRPGGMPNTSKQDVFLPEILQNCSPKYVTREMDRVQKNLEALRERLQEVVNQQRAAWHMKVSKCSQRLPRPPELSTAKRKEIQEAVGYELTTLDQDCGVKRHPCGLQRLVFRKAREPNNSGAQSVTKIIQLLKREEASLERTLRRLQEECQQELAILAHGLEGVIWIPPPYPRR
ncbi:tubulin epsilon and delta complex protein 1 isoform X1 [Monodelphis domestica]|uniref:tubulin epsilon and delta complex protein 1 isoform X1 n=1 Tax=Monodelphis domestica TaxID=13616 RepID=UPI0024E1FBF3|nr:tubulin epsilon and delta complex protein 1 isoform X1 [Monodelphis domestica]